MHHKVLQIQYYCILFVKPDNGVNSETSFSINVLSLTFGRYKLNFILLVKKIVIPV